MGYFIIISYVLRTGFDTEKGKIIRTVLYNTNAVKNTDGYILIFILLVFAIICSGYVLYHGM